MDRLHLASNSVERLKYLYVRGDLTKKVMRQMEELGIAPTSPYRWLSFAEVQKFAQSLGVRSQSEWRSLVSKPGFPYNIPHKPAEQYKNSGWKGWDHFLGKRIWTYEESREFLTPLSLESGSEYRAYYKGKRVDLPPVPKELPASPRNFYGTGFNWQYFLGNESDPNHSDPMVVSCKTAKKFAHKLGLATASEWKKYASGGLPELVRRPAFIPYNPQPKYKHSADWKGWEDFLGFEGLFTWEEAQKYVQGELGITKQKDWEKYRRGDIEGLDPEDMSPRMPKSPAFYYESQGIEFSWGALFGKSTKKAFTKSGKMPYVDARKFARSLGFSKSQDWILYVRGKKTGLPDLPLSIPKCPNLYYDNFDWGDFLGYDYIRKGKDCKISSNDIIKFIKKYKIVNQKEWGKTVKHLRKSKDKADREAAQSMPVIISQYLKRNKDLGVTISSLFPDSKSSFSQKKVIINLREQVLIPLSKRCKYEGEKLVFDPSLVPSYGSLKGDIASLKLLSEKDWCEWYSGNLKREYTPNLMIVPRNPEVHYSEFEGWRSFLGAEIPFSILRDYARKVGLRNLDEWNSHILTAKDIPDGVCKKIRSYKEWRGVKNFFGDVYSRKRYRRIESSSYESAREFVHTLKFKNRSEWEAYSYSKNRSSLLPSTPDEYYGDEFLGWNDWLGPTYQGYQVTNLWGYERAKNYIIALGFKSKDEFLRHRRSPDFIAKHPDLVFIYKDPQSGYKDKGWINWAHFLGK